MSLHGWKALSIQYYAPFKTLNEVGRLRAKNHSWRIALIFLDLIFSLRPSQNHKKFGVRIKSSTKYLKIFRVNELPSSRLQKLKIVIGGKRIWFDRQIRKRGGTEFYRTQIWTFRLRVFRDERSREHTIGIYRCVTCYCRSKYRHYIRIIIIFSYII